MFTAEFRARVEQTLNSLPHVKWDRFVHEEHHDREVSVYGWIDRDDGRADFVLVDFDDSGEWTGFSTSSARHSLAIYAALLGVPEERAALRHNDCLRVDEHFPGVRRTTRNPDRRAAA